jgi:hypothetical protein
MVGEQVISNCNTTSGCFYMRLHGFDICVCLACNCPRTIKQSSTSTPTLPQKQYRGFVGKAAPDVRKPWQRR